MKAFEEGERYNLPHLKQDSVVMDFGAHEGRWGRLIAEKYGCRVCMFEPIGAFFTKLQADMAAHPLADRFSIYPLGVGATTRRETFHVHGDMSGIVADGPAEDVQLIGIDDLLNNSLFGGVQFGAVKINIEGGEYELMEAMLEHGLVCRFDHIQIQFHDVVPRAAERMAYIKNMLLLNHRPVFDAGMVWCGWELK